MRLFWLVAGLGVFLAVAGPLRAAVNDEIITEATAQRYGLTRVWVTQAQVNRGQGRLQAVTLYDDALYAQTSRATLEAIDAETGQKMWAKLVGQPDYPTTRPGACGDLVGAINGSRLFVLNRFTGDILYETACTGAPGGGPALSTKRAYVPTVSGIIYSYRLEPIADAAKELGKIDPNAASMTDDEKKEAAKKAEEERRENIRINQDFVPPLACACNGRALVQPIVTTQNRDEEFVSWVTDKGYLHLGRVDRRSADSLVMKFRLLANGPFNSPPAYLPPDPKVLGDAGIIIAGSSDGIVYAISEHDGEIVWKFSAGDPVTDSPVVLEDRVYVTTELGGLFALNVKTGKQVWWSPEIMHFVAAGRQRIYAADKLGRLRILDGHNGAMLDILPTSDMAIKVCNTQNDRIYLGTEGGLLQCLREVEETKPIAYNASRKPAADDDKQASATPKPRPKAGGAAGGAPAAKPAAHPAGKKAGKAKDDNAFDNPALGGDDAGKPDAAPAKGGKDKPKDDADPFGGK